MPLVCCPFILVVKIWMCSFGLFSGSTPRRIRPCQWLLLLLLVGKAFVANGQKNADTLSNVIISAGKVRQHHLQLWTAGQKTLEIDSTTLAQYRMLTIAHLVGEQLPVYVRSYSLNGLSTFSFRGASAAQTQVLWNGVPLQNPASGVADLSEVPASFVSKATVIYGGDAALTGSGNVGGALLLDNNAPVFDSGRHGAALGLGYGSFGQYAVTGEGIVGNNARQVSLKITGQTATNNFSYVDELGVVKRLTNGKTYNYGALLQVAQKTGAHSYLQLSLWPQQYVRQIPPALFEPASVKQQDDRSNRSLLEWVRQTRGGKWYFRTSWMSDNIVYDDSLTGTHTHNRSAQYFQQLGWEGKWGKYHHLTFFTPLQYATLKQDGDKPDHTQQRIALVGADRFDFANGRATAIANLRAEQIDANMLVLPGASLRFMLANTLALRVSVQRTYRAPSLSELYYFPGGNTSLKSEKGWSADAGYTFSWRNIRWRLTQSTALYARDVHDWIIWLGGAIWTPHNIARVYSRGVETEQEFACTKGKWGYRIQLTTAYVLSTVTQSYQPNDGSVNQQIPYAPRYNVRGVLAVNYAKWMLQYKYAYTGYRSTIADGSEYLRPFQLSGVRVGYTAAYKAVIAEGFLQLINMWNEQYMLVEGRPMPRRNAMLGLSFSWR
ncbi:MAG: TonB-dependent receptor [Chitinophagia bacterium]|nr:TonB-dependent receptor [Chitinophagia bacterium]